jgi:hypothetical protein
MLGCPTCLRLWIVTEEHRRRVASVPCNLSPAFLCPDDDPALRSDYRLG